MKTDANMALFDQRAAEVRELVGRFTAATRFASSLAGLYGRGPGLTVVQDDSVQTRIRDMRDFLWWAGDHLDNSLELYRNPTGDQVDYHKVTGLDDGPQPVGVGPCGEGEV
jgi:hypothetical protein